MPTDLQFAAAADAIIEDRPRFQHRGRSKAGIDCVGLVFLAAKRIGLAVAPFIDYATTPDPNVLLAAVARRCEERAWGEFILPGRVLVFRHRHNGEARHFGVSVGDGWAVHTNGHPVRARIVRETLHSTWLLRGLTPTVTT